jgi:predicted transcriptional regulator
MTPLQLEILELYKQDAVMAKVGMIADNIKHNIATKVTITQVIEALTDLRNRGLVTYTPGPTGLHGRWILTDENCHNSKRRA